MPTIGCWKQSSLFDAIQVVENGKLNGTLILANKAQLGRVYFNRGRIVDADCGGVRAEAGFRNIVEMTSGSFEFKKSASEFPVKIQASSNTNLVLDTLRKLDEQKQ